MNDRDFLAEHTKIVERLLRERARYKGATDIKEWRTVVGADKEIAILKREKLLRPEIEDDIDDLIDALQMEL